MPESFEVKPEKPSMNEAQTLAFLQENGVSPIGDSWQPGMAILHVLDEAVRMRIDDRGQPRPAGMVASIARVDNPTKLEWAKKSITDPDDMLGYVQNDGGQIDYYAIHPDTKEPILVGTSAPMRMKRPFVVRRKNTFVVADELFPKSNR